MTNEQQIEVLKQRLLDLVEEILVISNQLATLAESILRSQEKS
jgi:hypothetical protein